MQVSELVEEASLFAAAAFLLALATVWLRRDLRKDTMQMTFVMLVGLAGLVLVERFGPPPGEGPFGGVMREAALAILAIGAARITVTFAFRAALGRVAVPQILAEVLMALVLVVFAFWRMTAVGVNLAGIVTTSAVVTGVLAFSLQETLGNLWGGIQLQLDNTCRIGDWIHVDTVTGQVIDIRWRYVAIATNSGETVIIPNGSLSKSRVHGAVAPRRQADSMAARSRIRRGLRRSAGPGDRCRRGGTRARRKFPTSPSRRTPTVLCRHFGDSAYEYVAPLLAHQSRAG
jgi:small-conductance mechanosensitive channel